MSHTYSNPDSMRLFVSSAVLAALQNLFILTMEVDELGIFESVLYVVVSG
jgi:hypothetical protein